MYKKEFLCIWRFVLYLYLNKYFDCNNSSSFLFICWFIFDIIFCVVLYFSYCFLFFNKKLKFVFYKYFIFCLEGVFIGVCFSKDFFVFFIVFSC